MKYCLAGWILMMGVFAQAQLPAKLDAAWKKMTSDSQFLYATAGICVLDANTGTILFERNSNTGMAPASTQKVLTSIAAYEALGRDFSYKTNIGYTGRIEGKKLLGDIVVAGSGDPTFGSFRYANTKPGIILHKITNAVKNLPVTSVGNLVATNNGFDINPTPDGWQWGDIGNYYGAGAWGLNWLENQYTIKFRSGNTKGDATSIAQQDATELTGSDVFYNEVKTGTASTGDGSVIYSAPFSAAKLLQGNITSAQNGFEVSGASSAPDLVLLQSIRKNLAAENIAVSGTFISPSVNLLKAGQQTPVPAYKLLFTHQSPTLDSMVFWFMKKSINLYGEALMRTIGQAKKGYGSNENGLAWTDSMYKANGFDTRAMHMVDGSGLSPTNRLTPYILARALHFAKGRSWFAGFYDAFPVYNGMKLKSGTIHRAKAFAGYHGNYIVTIMANNYNGSAAALVNKMFKVLDELK